MSTSFSFVIRDGLASDIPACLTLESTYETERVWQMTIHEETDQYSATFKTERLPRTMEVEYLLSEDRLRSTLAREHCFLVAVGKDEPETLGFLTMRSDPIHRIALVQDIVVSLPFRRRGIGSRLLRIARQWAVERELFQLMLETQTKNHPAIAFCRKAGLAFCGYNDQYFPNQDIAVFFGQSLR